MARREPGKEVTFSSPFLAHAGPLAAELAGEQTLEAVLAGLWEAGRQAWPEVQIPPDAFVRHVAEALVADRPAAPLAALERVFTADLYLACGCARGDAAAVAAFEQAYIERLPMTALARRGLPGDFLAELKQVLRERLLVGGPDQAPRIARYSGRGPLAAWVQVAAARTAVNLREAYLLRAGRPAGEPDQLAADDDPELDFFRREYGPEFKEAFGEALAALPSRDALMMRFYYLEGMKPEQIGSVFGASKRSIQRWIAEVRQAVLARTREGLAARCNLTASQLDAIVALLHEDLDLTLSRYLRRPKA